MSETSRMLAVTLWWDPIKQKGMLMLDDKSVRIFGVVKMTELLVKSVPKEDWIVDVRYHIGRGTAGADVIFIDELDLPLEADCKNADGTDTAAVAHLHRLFQKNSEEIAARKFAKQYGNY